MNAGGLSASQQKDRAQRRASRTRRRLMDAALAMFSETGFDATRIEQITERADVGKGTFYRHFSNKDEVMVLLVNDAVDHLVERIREPMSPASTLQQVLEHLLAAHLDFFQNRTDEFLLLFQGRLYLKLQRDANAELEPPMMRYLEEIESQLSPYVVQPMNPSKVRRLACGVAGFVSGFFSFAMIGMTPQDIERSMEPLRRAFVEASMTFLGR